MIIIKIELEREEEDSLRESRFFGRNKSRRISKRNNSTRSTFAHIIYAAVVKYV